MVEMVETQKALSVFFAVCIILLKRLRLSNHGYEGMLLAQSEVVFCCLNKNTVLLHEAEFGLLGNKKILFNTGLSPAWDEPAFVKWLEGDNLCYCDTVGALGGEHLLEHPNVRCMQVSTGRTRQAFDRLSEKVLANIKEYLQRQD